MDMVVLTRNTRIKPMNPPDKKVVIEAFKTENTISQSAIIKFKKNTMKTNNLVFNLNDEAFD